MRDPALQKAIEIVGGVNALARKLGLRSAAISQWRRVPGGRVLAVEAATDGRMTRYELRPDLYPKDEAA